jgi:hypothetical protein
VDLVVATRVDEQGRAGVEGLLGVRARGGHRAVPAEHPKPRHRQHEVVCELVEAALDAEVRTERQREHMRVGREVAA